MQRAVFFYWKKTFIFPMIRAFKGENMKAFLILPVLMILPNLLFAETYDLDFSLSLNGQEIAKPKVTIESGEVATIVSEVDGKRNDIEVKATAVDFSGEKSIHFDFKISQTDREGITKVIASPQVWSVEGEEATLETGNDSETLELKVKAKKL